VITGVAIPRHLSVLLLLATGCTAARGRTSTAGALDAELRATERTRGDALRAADTAALAALYADDFVMITSAGQLRSKADQLGDVAGGTVQHQGGQDRLLRVKRYGEVAVVLAESAANTLVVGGRPDPHARRYTRIYIRRAGRWQLLLTQISVLPDSAAGR
jgi:ketosteroid isomerase-like protein